MTCTILRDLDEERSGHTQIDDEERLIYFTGEVTEVNVSSAIAAMFSMSLRSRKPIHMLIETYGGSIDSMFALYDAMKYIPCEIKTIALGKVMSAGVLIFAAGHKGSRLIAPHARLMTHPASCSVEGNIYEVRHELVEIERLESLWIDAMIRETGKDRKFFEQLNSRMGDQYLTPEECIKFGIADRLLYDLQTVKSHANMKKKTTRKKA